MRPLLLTLALLVLGNPPGASGASVKEVEALRSVFRDAGVTGTFAVLDPIEDVLLVHNERRARQRFAPASTFKLVNTLVGLDAGAVASVYEVLPYGGKPQSIPAWEKDMPLREAIRISNIPVYQELARRIGLERMSAALKKLGYGNAETGTVVDRFWLDGPLEISAVEQIDFLNKLAAGTLPVSKQAMASVREISLQETTDSFRLYGKTGWLTSSTPKIGWYVGWIEKDGKARPFALNIDMPKMEDAPKRVQVAKDCLRILGKLD